MLKEIILQNLKRIEEEVDQIEEIQRIDFTDIFPVSEAQHIQLEEEAMQEAKLIDTTPKGKIYLLNTPVKTKWGELQFLKIRFFDETRLQWEAAADFAVTNWDQMKEKTKTDNRYTFISRPNWDAVEYKTQNSLLYFLNPLVTEVYRINK